MKTKDIITAALIVALIVSIVLVARSCGLDARYKRLKAEYAEAVRVAEADNAIQQEAIRKAEAQIKAQDEIILDHTASVALKNAEIAELRRQLTTIVDEEPIQPELEGEPLVINLRKQIKWTTDMLVLTQGVVEDQKKQLAAWELKYDAQVEISESWKRQYENERALRVQAEDMFKVAEHRVGLNKTITTVALGLAAGAVLYGAIK